MNSHNIAIEEEDSFINSNFNEENWVCKMKSLLNKQNSSHEIEFPISIFKLPNSIKSINFQPYTPQYIALGPYHNFHPKLYKSQRFKLYQAQILHLQFNLPGFKILSNQIEKKLTDIRSCYEQSVKVSDQALSWMMVIDGLFLLRLMYIQGSETELFDESGRKFSADSILKDVVKVENQIPFFVLEHLVARRNPKCPSGFTSLLVMAIRFCSGISPISLQGKFFREDFVYPSHVLDLLYKLILLGGNSESSIEVKRASSRWISHKVSRVLGVISGSNEEEKGLIPSASQLSNSKVIFVGGFGIKFIQFNDADVSFHLPILTLNCYSDVVIRNLMAYEAMVRPESPDFARFIEMMAAMIKTVEDVEVLRSKGIVKYKGNCGEVVKLFKEIGEECNNIKVHVSNGKSEIIEGVIKVVNEYYESNWRTKVKIILNKYVYSSWKMLTVIATMWLLLLTTIQTFCSIYSCPNIFEINMVHSSFVSQTGDSFWYLDA